MTCWFSGCHPFKKTTIMTDKRKDLPANSDANKKVDDKRFQQQEEFDNRGKDDLQRESEVRNTQRDEQLRDSQQGDERMVPESKSRVHDKNGKDQHLS
jgi:hypothetical protein